APVVRNAGEEREMVLMRWGMPPPPKLGGAPVTNIRNTSSPHWRGWLKPENRCLVPFNSFAEYASEPNPETDRPLTCFAGIAAVALRCDHVGDARRGQGRQDCSMADNGGKTLALLINGGGAPSTAATQASRRAHDTALSARSGIAARARAPSSRSVPHCSPSVRQARRSMWALAIARVRRSPIRCCL